MKRKIRNWVMGALWSLGLVELPWWDDVRIVAYEDEKRVPTVSGEALRAALSARLNSAA